MLKIILQLVAALRIAQPLFLGQVIGYFSPDGGVSTQSAYLFAAGVIACSAFNVLTHHQFFMGCELMGLRIRVACCSLLYRKVRRRHFFFGGCNKIK